MVAYAQIRPEEVLNRKYTGSALHGLKLVISLTNLHTVRLIILISTFPGPPLSWVSSRKSPLLLNMKFLVISAHVLNSFLF